MEWAANIGFVSFHLEVGDGKAKASNNLVLVLNIVSKIVQILGGFATNAGSNAKIIYKS